MRTHILQTMPFVLQIPKPEFRIEELGDSSVHIHVFVWYPKDDWSEAQPILLAKLKRALDNAEIEIPFPQRVIWSGKN